MMKMKPGIYWLLAGAATAFFILPSLAAADKVVVLPLMKHPVDRDRDGYHPPDDCDDSNPDVHPNADWHDTSAGGNVGWDWDCSGGGRKAISRGQRCGVTARNHPVQWLSYNVA